MPTLPPIVQQLLDNFNMNIKPELSPEQNAEEIIRSAALLSAAISAEPIPFADTLLITPVQMKMVLHIGRIYGFEITLARAQHIIGELATTFAYGMLARQVMRGVIKIIAPVIGGVITAPAVYGWTFALGKLAERYFIAQKTGVILPPRAELQQTAQKIMQDAASKINPQALNEFAQSLRDRKKQDQQQISKD